MNREHKWTKILLDYSISRNLYYHIEEYNNIIYLMSLKDKIPFNILQWWEDLNNKRYIHAIVDIFDVSVRIELYKGFVQSMHYVTHHSLSELKKLNNENN
jgi:hypothetical protein